MNRFGKFEVRAEETPVAAAAKMERDKVKIQIRRELKKSVGRVDNGMDQKEHEIHKTALEMFFQPLEGQQ